MYLIGQRVSSLCRYLVNWIYFSSFTVSFLDDHLLLTHVLFQASILMDYIRFYHYFFKKLSKLVYLSMIFHY